MTAPQTPTYRQPGYWSPVRLIAVAAVIATILCGFMVIFATLSATSLTNWTGAGLVSAGVALACMIIL